MNINRSLYQQKNEILHYLRDRAAESYGEIIKVHGERDYKNEQELSIKRSKKPRRT